MAGVVMCGRLDTFKSVVFPAYVSRWPRMGEYFITKRADHLSPLVVGEVVQSRGAAVKESTDSHGYFDEAFLPKSVVLNDEQSIEARFPFPTFPR